MILLILKTFKSKIKSHCIPTCVLKTDTILSGRHWADDRCQRQLGKGLIFGLPSLVFITVPKVAGTPWVNLGIVTKTRFSL